MARPDDCFLAALATVTQISIEQLPDPNLDRLFDAGGDPDEMSRDYWARLDRSQGTRGLTLRFHQDTLPLDRERWIGVCVASEAQIAHSMRALSSGPYTTTFRNGAREFADHSLVMAFDAIHFDPAATLPAPPHHRSRPYRASDVTYGITVDRKD
jgi:hypothetical protein